MKLRTWMVLGAATAGGLAVARSASKSDAEVTATPYEQAKTKVLILGGGFGGLYTAKDLAGRLRGNREVSIAVLDRHDYFTFWPMVPDVVSGSIDVQHVLRPLRWELKEAGVNFIRAEVQRVDLGKKQVDTSVGSIPFDKLVIALGWQTNYFGIKGAGEHAIPVESATDALRIRESIIDRFEEAAGQTLEGGKPEDGTLGFVVVGGGSSGVEVAANISELISSLKKLYPKVSSHVTVSLVQAKDDVLPHMEPGLRKAAAARLKAEEIHLVADARAAEISASRVTLERGKHIPAKTVVWAAGVESNPIARNISGAQPDEKGRLRTDQCLRLEGREGIYCLGDIAAVSSDGKSVGPTAQAAVQEASAVAENLAAELEGGPEKAFHYRHMGQLVELGSSFAVNQVMGKKMSGRLAQLMWRAVYLYKLGSNRERVGVLADWLSRISAPPVVARVPIHS